MSFFERFRKRSAASQADFEASAATLDAALAQSDLARRRAEYQAARAEQVLPDILECDRIGLEQEAAKGALDRAQKRLRFLRQIESHSPGGSKSEIAAAEQEMNRRAENLRQIEDALQSAQRKVDEADRRLRDRYGLSSGAQ